MTNILTLSGWTQPADALVHTLDLPMAAWVDYSDYPDREASFAALARYRQADCVVGWSLGGQLALQAIAAGVLAPKRLVLIAAPYQFVSNAQFAGGMDPTTYRLFRASYASDPARTKQRFHALIAKGDREAKQVMGMLGHHWDVENTSRWLPWLDQLGRDSLIDVPLVQLPPTILIHGENDAIVPLAQSETLQEKLPHAILHRWEEAGHAPHLRDTQRLRNLILSESCS